MKRTLSTILLCLLIAFTASATSGELKEKLSSLPKISNLEALESDHFPEKYVLFIEQPLDHQYPESGSFKQRVIVSHAGFDRPTVIVTEGYSGAYALNSRYRDELSQLFNTNMVFVEHRYFLESTPEPLNWEYLTARNSAFDLHEITTLMKQIYPEKWISTGISKGGQTTIIYRAFFPNDVDISVPYVAPVCKAAEDGRHEPFLRQVSSAGNRKKIYNFQLEVFKRKEQLIPLFKAYCEEKALTFRVPLEDAFDYSVLEYPFAIWQWGTPINTIPPKSADNEMLFKHLRAISDPSYFAQDQPNASFFVQAARELGYYGYDTEPFKQYLSIQTSKDYLQRLMLPEGLTVEFRPELYQKITAYLNDNDPRMIFIYGGNDPWTAAGVTEFTGKENMFVAIEPNGSHLARISTLPTGLKKEVIKRITNWLKE